MKLQCFVFSQLKYFSVLLMKITSPQKQFMIVEKRFQRLQNYTKKTLVIEKRRTCCGPESFPYMVKINHADLTLLFVFVFVFVFAFISNISSKRQCH